MIFRSHTTGRNGEKVVCFSCVAMIPRRDDCALKLWGKETLPPFLTLILSIFCHRNEKRRSYEVLIQRNQSKENFPHLQQGLLSHWRGKADCYWHVLFTWEMASLCVWNHIQYLKQVCKQTDWIELSPFLKWEGKLETDLMTSPWSFIELVVQLRQQASFKQV